MKSQHKAGFYEKYIKRLLDIICSGCAIVILSLVMLVVAVMVRAKLGTPVLFAQERPGRNEKIFRMYKFRTMTDACDSDGNPLSDEERLTPFGEKLRSTSLDELPELINIFKGDMSVVGPRPLLVQYLERYDETQRRRHEVRPGLTGLAQVNGRNGIAWDERFVFDVEYVDNVSFLLDCKILLKTVSIVFKREGISSDSSATMTEFKKDDDKDAK